MVVQRLCQIWWKKVPTYMLWRYVLTAVWVVWSLLTWHAAQHWDNHQLHAIPAPSHHSSSSFSGLFRLTFLGFYLQRHVRENNNRRPQQARSFSCHGRTRCYFGMCCLYYLFISESIVLRRYSTGLWSDQSMAKRSIFRRYIFGERLCRNLSVPHPVHRRYQGAIFDRIWEDVG